MTHQRAVLRTALLALALAATACDNDDTVIENTIRPGVVQLSAAQLSVAENAGTLAIGLVRAGGADGTASVRVRTGGGNAVAGTDFTALDTVVSWAAGDAAPKTVSLAVIDDSADGADVTVNLSLSDVTGASAGVPLSAVVTIADDEPTTPASISLSFLGRFSANAFNQGAAEIVAFDPASRRAFVVNGATDTVDVLNLADPAAPVAAGTLDLSLLGLGAGASANSVAVRNGLVAVAVQREPKTGNGKLGLYNAGTLTLVGSADLGALPDMLTFTPDGSKVLVANEGEPQGYVAGQLDPEGSVSIVNVTAPATPTVQTVSFASLNAQAATLRQAGVRLFGPNATVAQDLEPEYIALAPDGLTAYVTFQENNALGTIDVTTAMLTSLAPLGAKNHLQPGNALDASDRDGAANAASVLIQPLPVYGLYMPDSIAAYRVGGQDYIVTANEGDAREWPGLLGGTDPAAAEAEDARAGSLTLDAVAFPDGAALKTNGKLARLNVSRFSGDSDGDGDYERLFALGARSFSIFRPNGSLVFDSGSDFEDILSGEPGVVFNADHTNNSLDNRSDNKGPEPEALALARFGDKTFAFIGLERDGGIMAYDISEPARPLFVDYATGRVSGTGDITAANFTAFGDLGPEGLQFVPAADSPTGTPLLLVANEVSGTTTIYRVNLAF